MKKRRVGRGKPAIPIYVPPPREIFNKGWLEMGFSSNQVIYTIFGFINRDSLYDKITGILTNSINDEEINSALIILKLFHC